MGKKRSRICAELASVVGRHPSLLRDLPHLLASLDRGAPTAISHLDVDKQRALRDVFETLPLREVDFQGQASWVKDSDCESVSEVLLAALTKKGVIREESRLLASESFATSLLDSLSSYLEDDNLNVAELRFIFESLSRQGFAPLSHYHDRVWFTNLAKAAAAVGLILTDSDELRVPENTLTSLSSELQECCALLYQCLEQSVEPPPSIPSRNQMPTDAIHQSKVTIGPARPTAEEASIALKFEPDSDEDMVGPLPVEVNREQKMIMEPSKGLEETESKAQVAEPIREEWMLSPGERDPFAGTMLD